MQRSAKRKKVKKKKKKSFSVFLMEIFRFGSHMPKKYSDRKNRPLTILIGISVFPDLFQSFTINNRQISSFLSVFPDSKIQDPQLYRSQLSMSGKHTSKGCYTFPLISTWEIQEKLEKRKRGREREREREDLEEQDKPKRHRSSTPPWISAGSQRQTSIPRRRVLGS